jgi:hypothetical protein
MITMLYEKTLNRKILGGVDNENPDAAKPDATAHTAPAQESDDESGASEADGLLNGNANGSTKKKKLPRSYFANCLDTIMAGFSLTRKQKEKSKKKMPTSMGKLLNLMRSDVYEVAQRFWEIQTLVNKPVGLILSIALVWKVIGWPCLIGIAVVVVAQILNGILARILISWEKVRRKVTDTRLQKTSQYGKVSVLSSPSGPLY